MAVTRIDKERFGPWAVVTGASAGIGREFARQLAASGLHLVLVARRLSALEALGQELAPTYGVQYRAVEADLSGDTMMDTLTAATRDLDIGLLISNAGAGVPGEFLHFDYATLRQMVQLNALSHLALTHHFGQRMAKRRRGGILLVSAMGASEGIPYMANDAAAKAYVTSLGEGLHLEFKKYGLNTTMLLPGPTDTPIVDKLGFNRATMPLKPMSVEQCAAEGLAALNAHRSAHLSGRVNRLIRRVIPAAISRRVIGSLLAQGIQRRQLTAQIPGEVSR